MDNLPYQWADWDTFSRRVRGFIEWAEPAPQEKTKERYAICLDSGIRWARVSPCPNVPVEYSTGCFYGDTQEEAMRDARQATIKHRQKVEALLAEG